VVLVAVQLSVLGSYLPPVFKKNWLSLPPHTIISLPVQTAVCKNRAEGTSGKMVLVAVQLSVLGLYLPPVFVFEGGFSICPPHTIISLPLQTAVQSCRPTGALVVLVAIQLSVLGLYLPPVFRKLPLYPPQTTISLPVHTTV